MLGHAGLGVPNLAALGVGVAVPAQNINVGLYANTQTFYAPVVAFESAQDIAVALFSDPDTFYAAQIDVVALPNQILVQLFVDDDQFYAPIVALEAAQQLVVAQYIDPDQFYPPAFLGALTDQTITVGHLLNVQSFMQADFVVAGKEPTYDYPIGHGLYSDYGIRAAMTSYKKRMIIGNRR